MRFAMLLSWLAACSLGAALAGPAPAGSAGPLNTSLSSVLGSVRALETPVTLTETKIPLGELVQKVGAETGVSLTAAPGVADEPVAVVARALPARRLLEQLAELLDYQWRRRGREGAWQYEIWQDSASRQREVSLRRAVLADVERRFDEEVRRYMEIAALSPEKLVSLLDAEEKSDRPLSPRQIELARRGSIARELASPLPRLLASLMGQLSSQQWAQLKADYPVSFSSDPQPGEGRLSADVVQGLRASPPRPSLPSVDSRATPPAEEERQRQAVQKMQQEWSAADGYLATIRLDADAWKKGGSLNLNITAAPLSAAALSPSSPIKDALGGSLSLGIAPGPFLDGIGTPQRRAAASTDPVFRSRKRFQPEGKPRAGSAASDSAHKGRLQELLPEVARFYGLSILSDAYWYSSPEVPGSALPSEPIALSRLLDRLAGPTHDWDYQAGVLLLRSRTWHFDRPREIPHRLVRLWRRLYQQQGALPLETYLQMVISLTDTQLGSLGDLVSIAGLPREIDSAYPARHALRLYAVLTPAQREALWRGAALPAAQMTPLQGGLFVTALRSQLELPPSPREALGIGSVSLGSTPYLRVWATRGDSTRHRDLPAAALETRRTDAPLTASGAPRATSPQIETEAAITRIAFRYQLAGQDLPEISVTIASPLGSSPIRSGSSSR